MCVHILRRKKDCPIIKRNTPHRNVYYSRARRSESIHFRSYRHNPVDFCVWVGTGLPSPIDNNFNWNSLPIGTEASICLVSIVVFVDPWIHRCRSPIKGRLRNLNVSSRYTDWYPCSIPVRLLIIWIGGAFYRPTVSAVGIDLLRWSPIRLVLRLRPIFWDGLLLSQCIWLEWKLGKQKLYDLLFLRLKNWFRTSKVR